MAYPLYDERQDSLGRSVGPPNAVVRGPGAHGGAAFGEQTSDLLEVFPTVRRRLGAVLLVALLFTGAAVGFDLWRAPVYEASAKLLVGQEPTQGDGQDGLSNNSVQGLQQITQTMAEAADSRPVAEEVIESRRLQTSPEDLLENTSVEQIGETQFIGLTYRDTDPARARDVANSLGTVSSERITEAGASAGNIRATVWEQAAVPETPVSPSPVRDGLLAAALGLMFGVGLALLLEHLDNTWRSPEEVELVSGVPTFGVIPRFDAVKGAKK